MDYSKTLFHRTEEIHLIKIYTDTSANLPEDIIEKYGLAVIPFSYSVNGIETTGENFDGKGFYDAMRAGTIVKTSMINCSSFIEAFGAELSLGNDVIYIGMSGGISGTAHAAEMAADELRAEFPQRRIAVIDTFAASLGEGMQVIKAAEMRNSGESFDRIVERISAERHTMCQYFTVDDLEYLKRGGRLSRTSMALGTVLKIKPTLMGDKEGKIVLCGKVRGRRQSLLALADKYEEYVRDKSEDIGVAHADDAESADFLIDELRKRGCRGKCMTVCYEPVTGSHVGPGTVALFFTGSSDHR